jgi:hypothetical protein
MHQREMVRKYTVGVGRRSAEAVSEGGTLMPAGVIAL